MNCRFAAVISHPIQHYAPVFRELAQVRGIDVKVFYASDWAVKPTYDPDFQREFAWDVPLLSGYDHEFLPRNRRAAHQGFFEIDSPQLAPRLEAYSPHVVWIHGYGHRVSWRALGWARRRAAALFFGDSELLRKRSLWRRTVKSVVVREFFRHCNGFITIGDRNEEYYAHYGVPRKKMFRGACPIDVRRFQAAVAAPDRPRRTDLRARYGLPQDAVVVVFSGKLIDLKRPFDLLQAIETLVADRLRVAALYVGEGPLRSSLERAVFERGLQERVRFAGFVNQREIPLVLDCGDILAVTSERDAHPLAVAESMAVGHAIVASDRVGCVGSTDAARPGINALTYPAGDVPALASVLRQLVESEPLRRGMSQSSLALAATQDIRQTAAAVVRAVRALRPDFSAAWQDVSADVLEGLEREQSRLEAAACP
jgi:glycosyltransferase involved in cell wall biosynthesis